MARQYRVNELAQLAGVSVRTLHHYDAIGLLVPTGRSQRGYRLYDDDALLRLQQILIGRELGLSLEEIRRSLDDPKFDLETALRDQRRQLAARTERTERMIAAVDRALGELGARKPRSQEKPMRTEDWKSLFDGFEPSKYGVEAEARWGNTDAWAESKRRTKGYTTEDWQRIRDEQAAIYGAAVLEMKAGHAATDVTAMDVAEQHRLAIDRWFYPCNHAMHRGLADMYEADERFAQNIDKFGKGLTPYLAAAIRANADRAARAE